MHIKKVFYFLLKFFYQQGVFQLGRRQSQTNNNCISALGLSCTIVGQLEILLERFDKGENGGLSMDIRTRIQKLKQEATSISEEAVSFVKRGDEEYYKDLHFVVSRPWILWKSQRVLNFSSLWGHDVYFSNKSNAWENICVQIHGFYNIFDH